MHAQGAPMLLKHERSVCKTAPWHSLKCFPCSMHVVDLKTVSPRIRCRAALIPKPVTPASDPSQCVTTASMCDHSQYV
eukprot:358553-Chlamydomonas_euryale.AAC.4